MLHGLAYGVAGTVLLALALETRPEGYSAGALMGWYTALLAGGHAVGNALGGILADQFGFAVAFMAAGALQLPAAATCWSVRLPLQAPAQARSAATRSSFGRVREALRSPGVLAGSLLAVYLNLLDQAVNAFFPIFGLGAGLTLSSLGFVRTTKSLSAALVRPFVGAVLQRVRLGPLNLSLVCAFAAAVFALPFGYGPLAFAALVVVIGVTRGFLRATSAAQRSGRLEWASGVPVHSVQVREPASS